MQSYPARRRSSEQRRLLVSPFPRAPTQSSAAPTCACIQCTGAVRGRCCSFYGDAHDRWHCHSRHPDCGCGFDVRISSPRCSANSLSSRARFRLRLITLLADECRSYLDKNEQVRAFVIELAGKAVDDLVALQEHVLDMLLAYTMIGTSHAGLLYKSHFPLQMSM